MEFKLGGKQNMSKIAEVKANVEAGKAKIVPGLVQEALNEGAGAQEILAAMIEGMGVVGDKFSSGEIFVPEMLVAARAMQKGVEVLKPLLAGEGAVTLGTCIIGTVAGDLHDIGKNLVNLMIESAGFDMIDLGVDVEGADRGVPRMASREHGAKILDRLRRLSRPLGTTIEIKDGVGLIRVAGATK